jgi:hypothetical protein
MGIAKTELVARIRELLMTDADLGFLLQLGGEELKTLIASIRERLDRVGQRAAQKGKTLHLRFVIIGLLHSWLLYVYSK